MCKFIAQHCVIFQVFQISRLINLSLCQNKRNYSSFSNGALHVLAWVVEADFFILVDEKLMRNEKA